MIHAEVSIYPMATKTPSVSFYIAKAIEAVRNTENLRCEVGPMGTVLESDEMGTILAATESMAEAVHNLGVARVEIVLKIDSRRDKHTTMQEKTESVKRQMG